MTIGKVIQKTAENNKQFLIWDEAEPGLMQTKRGTEMLLVGVRGMAEQYCGCCQEAHCLACYCVQKVINCHAFFYGLPYDNVGSIYFILAPHSMAVKIGFTTGSAADRLCQLQIGTPEPLMLLGQSAGTMIDEIYLHAKHESNRIRGEWFKLTKETRDEIKSVCSPVDDPDWGLCSEDFNVWLNPMIDDVRLFDESLWNCKLNPDGLPSTPKRIESWMAKPKLY